MATKTKAPAKKTAAATNGKAGNGSTQKTRSNKSQSAEASNAGAGADDSLLREFFVDSLKDIYWAEKKLVTTLPKMQKAATTQELRDALAEHREVTQGQVSRLEEVFGLLGEKAQAKKCEAMEGLVKEGEDIIEETEEGTSTRDVGIIMAAQKVEHYEIATYGGLATLARTLGEEEVAGVLEEILAEEKDADISLTGIAESCVNYQAAEEQEA